MDTSIDSLRILQAGTITLQGEFVWGSNYIFLVKVSLDGETLPAVYKPSRGERPLWDFPAASLARRETAAYLVSEMLKWHWVPATVYRESGPLGAGSLQQYIDHDPEYHYFNFSEQDRQRLRPVVVFDLLINNADRKGSHILIDPDGKLWLIDHGVCFHAEDKLRTVIWDFVGESIPADLCSDLCSFSDTLNQLKDNPAFGGYNIFEYLTPDEVLALNRRANSIVKRGIFPAPDPQRRSFPWPQI